MVYKTDNTEEAGLKEMAKGVVYVALLLLLLQRDVAEGGDGFITVRGTRLMLNGNPFYANGFNAYYLMFMATDPSQRYKVTSVFREARQLGLLIGRTWAFNDAQYHPLQTSPGSYNEQSFQALDFVISEASKFGIKLILSLSNNYDSFGGKKQYVNWARSRGQQVNSDDDFFRNPVIKQFYKNNVKTMLLRRNVYTGVLYKNDPTIMAWELMNEPRCTSDPSGTVIQSWISEMAYYVKSIDTSHLLEAGLEGFYGPSSSSRQIYNPSFGVGTDFISNNKIAAIDFATIHMYPDEWLTQSDEQTRQLFLEKWINIHIQDAQNILRKPLLFAEFGKSSRVSGTFQRDRLYRTIYDSILSSVRRGGVVVGGTFWQLFTEGMDSFRDGYEVVVSQNPSTAAIIAEQSRKVNFLRKMFKKGVAH